MRTYLTRQRYKFHPLCEQHFLVLNAFYLCSLINTLLPTHRRDTSITVSEILPGLR